MFPLQCSGSEVLCSINIQVPQKCTEARCLSKSFPHSLRAAVGLHDHGAFLLRLCVRLMRFFIESPLCTLPV